MEKFGYTAHKIGVNHRRKGTIEAQNLTEANHKIRELGLTPINISDLGKPTQGGFSLKKVSLKDKIIFTRQLAVMTKAGLPLINSLESLKKQTDNKYFQGIIYQIIRDVKGGQPLSRAMMKYPKVFPDVYVAVIKAGEQTGQLVDVLFNLADQQEKQAELSSKVRGALMYPAVIFIALIGVVFLIVFFVLPSLKGVFADMGGELPLTTKMLFSFSEIIRHYFFYLLIGFIAVIFGLRYWIAKPSGRHIFDRARLKFPIFGGLTKKVYMASFTRTMAMLTKASLPILQSLQIVRKTINNSLFDAAFERIQKAVENGKPLSAAIEREPIFPAMVSQLIALGEESGSLDTVLMEINRFYESEVDNLTKNMASLIEPFMLIIMGIGVGFIVASVLGPIYKLVGQF